MNSFKNLQREKTSDPQSVIDEVLQSKPLYNRVRNKDWCYRKVKYRDMTKRTIRSSHQKCSMKNVFKNFTYFTERHLCWSHFLINLQSWVYLWISRTSVTAQKMKFSIRDFFIKCDRRSKFGHIYIRNPNFIFCVMCERLFLDYSNCKDFVFIERQEIWRWLVKRRSFSTWP